MIRPALILAALFFANPAFAADSFGFGSAAAGATIMQDDPRNRDDSPYLLDRLFGSTPKPAPKPAESYDLPDEIMTPGVADPKVDLNEICNGTTKRRRPPSTKICDRVFADYSIPAKDRYLYECDHDIPVALGGATVAKNLWPQPLAEAHKKDALEIEMQRLACVAFRTLTPQDAAKVLVQEQREIADDWPAAYRHYVVGPSAAR